MHRLMGLLLIVLALLAGGTARAAEPGEELTISLLTMGPGEHPFTKFGHSALWVHDARAERDEVYNYGTFAFDSPTLLQDSISGKLPYWLSMQSFKGTLRSYGEAGRSLQASELELTPAQRAQLYSALRENERPEHRYYRYDYYRDNCATRVRDAIDAVLGGQLRRQTEQVPASMSYRDHTLRLVAQAPLLYVGLDLAIGQQTDVPITFWDEGFLPERLHDALSHARVLQGTRALPLIRSERTLLVSQLAEPPAVAPRCSRYYLLLGLVLSGSFVALGWAARTFKPARFTLGMVCALLGLVLGFLGTALCYLTFFSAHSAAVANYNVLLLPPWLLTLVVAGVGVARGKPAAFRWAFRTLQSACLLAALGLVIHLLGTNSQANAQDLAVALPLWLGLATALKLAARDQPQSRLIQGMQP